MDLITAQLFDPESKIVPIVALSVLDEASDDKLNLEAMVCSLQNKDLDHLGKYFFFCLYFLKVVRWKKRFYVKVNHLEFCCIESLHNTAN